ncbi:MAG: IPT/TIG domain-containing protein, partial [Deltaproteobacteria bacterium]|nr:IPT/TIG domain-containing protein [Deltaproteobacteria bacterium]
MVEKKKLVRLLRVLVGIVFVCLASCSGGPGQSDSGIDAGPDGNADGTDGIGDPGPEPILISIDPAQGPLAGGTPLVLSGSGFIQGASVRFGAAVAAGANVLSSSTIEVSSPPGSAGWVTVRVTNPNGLYFDLVDGFFYLAPLAGDCPRDSGCPPAEALFEYSTGNPADSVLLAGDFTGWRDGAVPMTGDESGNFSVRLTLKEGRYEYKLIVNDNDWRTDPAAGAPEPFFNNSVRLHDNPCTPNLTSVGPAYGQVFNTNQVTIEAGYLDGQAGAGIDPESICLVVEGARQTAEWNQAGAQIISELTDLSEGEHHWWMSAADSEGHRSAEISGMFLVNASGQPPIADAGPTLFAYPGEWVVLDGTWSRDPDGLGLSNYSWNQISGPAVVYQPQHVSLHGGYDDQPAAEPPRSDALMGFSAPGPGNYQFELTVSDADGISNTAIAELIVLNPGSAERPQAAILISQTAGTLTVAGSSNLPGSSFRWLADIRNPAPFGLPAGADLTLAAVDLPVEGSYFFNLIASKDGADSRPATALIKKSDNIISGFDFLAPPDWLADAQIYEIYVRAFADGNADGIGDLVGLTDNLDYLAELGVNTLWLMPVFESADHAHGYHTVNYRRVERDYGNNDDLAAFISAAHQQGMRVVLDLVINHTSRHHPRFKAALDSASRFRNHYIWFINHPESDPLIERYGFGRELGGSRLTIESGWADIPDVNIGNSAARDWAFGIARHWMDPNRDGDFSDGVDGFRLDHVTGPAHRVWKNLRRELKAIRPDLMLLAEVFRDFDNGGQGFGIKDYYVDEFDLAFTFPFYWVAQGIFKNGEPVGGCAEPCGLDWLMNAISERFRDDARMCFFIENHDVPWYTTVYEDWGRIAGKLIAANTLMQTLSNSPQILYG